MGQMMPPRARPGPGAPGVSQVWEFARIWAGLAEGLPVGMMIADKRFDDATCLRVAHAFESLAGGFPAPPGQA